MTSYESLESKISSEVSNDIYSDLVSSVANHEAKALTLAYMATQGKDRLFTDEELHDGMTAIQGKNPAWNQDTGVPYSYCELSLEPIGAASRSVITGMEGKRQRLYGLTELGRLQALAIAGFTLDWSLRYPDLSVQVLLGSTQSKTNLRAPIYRLAILDSVARRGELGASYEDVELDHPELDKIRTITETIKDSSLARVLDVNSNKVKYDPTLRILDTEYRGTRIAFEDLKPETQAIYGAMRELRLRQGIGRVGLNHFIDVASRQDPSLEPKKIRSTLMQAINPNRTALPGLKTDMDSRGVLAQHKSSVVTLKPDVREAVESFLNGLQQYKSGENHDALRRTATRIVADEDACNRLMGKALENSYKARVVHAAKPLGELVFELIGISDTGLPVQSILSTLESEHGVKVTPNAVRNHLARLVESGKVESHEVIDVNHGLSTKLKYYRTNTAIRDFEVRTAT